MTGEILQSLVRLNLAAGLAILLLLALRKPARALFGPRLAYALWLVVPVATVASLAPIRAPMPITLPSQLSIPSPKPAALSGPVVESATPPAHITGPVDPMFALTLLWLAGVAAGAGLVVHSQRRCLKTLGPLTRRDGMLHSARAAIGPAVLGALRPRIVLPADFTTRFSPQEQAMVLAHEQVHLARSDARINAVIVTMQCLNWFNPLVHIAAHLARVDQELACDAAVIARQPKARHAYGQAMLKSQLGDAALPLGCYWPARSEHPLKERLAMLKARAPGRPRGLVGGAAIAALALAGGYAAWAATPDTTPAPLPSQDAVSAALGAPAQPVVGKIAPIPPTPTTPKPAPPALADSAPPSAPAPIDTPPTPNEVAELQALSTASTDATFGVRTINLRNLGNGRTLILFDGVRLADPPDGATAPPPPPANPSLGPPPSIDQLIRRLSQQ